MNFYRFSIAKIFIGDLTSVARKSIDTKELVWDFANDDPILDKLKNSADVDIYNHAEILEIISDPKWTTLDIENPN